MGTKKGLNNDFISNNWNDFVEYVVKYHHDLLGDILAAAYDREAVSPYINGLILSAAADFQEYKKAGSLIEKIDQLKEGLNNE